MIGGRGGKSVATPRAARRLGEARLARWLKTKGVRKSDAIAGRVIAAAGKPGLHHGPHSSVDLASSSTSSADPSVDTRCC